MVQIEGICSRPSGHTRTLNLENNSVASSETEDRDGEFKAQPGANVSAQRRTSKGRRRSVLRRRKQKAPSRVLFTLLFKSKLVTVKITVRKKIAEASTLVR